MSHLLPLSSSSTPGWNDPPAVLNPSRLSSPDTGGLASRHRRPVHPSIQVLLSISSNFGCELLFRNTVVHLFWLFLTHLCIIFRLKSQSKISLRKLSISIRFYTIRLEKVAGATFILEKRLLSILVILIPIFN